MRESCEILCWKWIQRNRDCSTDLLPNMYDSKKLKEFGLSFYCFSEITNGDLNDLVKWIITHVPACGIWSIQTLFKVNGMILQRERFRYLDKRMYLLCWPLGLETYVVLFIISNIMLQAQNALWYIDGYYKLIR